VSMAVVMVAFSLLIGDSPLTPGNSGAFLASMQLVFLVFFMITLIGAFISRDRQTTSARVKRS